MGGSVAPIAPKLVGSVPSAIVTTFGAVVGRAFSACRPPPPDWAGAQAAASSISAGTPEANNLPTVERFITHSLISWPPPLPSPSPPGEEGDLPLPSRERPGREAARERGLHAATNPFLTHH